MSVPEIVLSFLEEEDLAVQLAEELVRADAPWLKPWGEDAPVPGQTKER